MDKILVFGDSIAYGKWDNRGGWVARLREYVDKKFNIGKGGNVQVYNLGIPGEVATRMVDRVKQELGFRITDPEADVLVIFSIGVNDSCPNNWLTNAQSSESDFKKAIRLMIEMAKSKAKVLVLGLAPVNMGKPTKRGLQLSNEEVKKYDGYISDICRELDTDKIDIFDDLMKSDYVGSLVDVVHPNSEGHKMIFERVREKIIV